MSGIKSVGRSAAAIRYARQALADPKVSARYDKLGKKDGRQPFRVAVSDYLAGNDWLDKK